MIIKGSDLAQPRKEVHAKAQKSLRFNVFAPYAFLNLAPWREIIAHPNWVL
jgi:hypothetical protein